MKDIKMMVLANVFFKTLLVQQTTKTMVGELKTVLQKLQPVLLGLKMMVEEISVFLVLTLALLDIRMMVEFYLAVFC